MYSDSVRLSAELVYNLLTHDNDQPAYLSTHPVRDKTTEGLYRVSFTYLLNIF